MGKGRKNKVLKLTPAKINYIIRSKTNNISSRIIAIEMKLSIRTVNRVWGHWVKNKEPLAPKSLDGPRPIWMKLINSLSLKSTKSKIAAQDDWNIIDHKFGRHIPHNAIHQFLLENDLANENKRKKKRRKPWIRYERKHSLTAVHLDWHTSSLMIKKFVWS